MKIQKRHIVLASLVVALSAAVFINWQFSDNTGMLAKKTSKELGAATYVNANMKSSDDEVTNVSKTTSTNDEYFAKAVVERDQARDEALEIAKETLTLSDSSEEAKTKAVEQLNKIEDNIVKENNVESVLIAKGFSQCLCIISEDKCSVAVLKKELKKNSPLIIKDAVVSHTNVEFNNITIIEV